MVSKANEKLHIWCFSIGVLKIKTFKIYRPILHKFDTVK